MHVKCSVGLQIELSTSKCRWCRHVLVPTCAATKMLAFAVTASAPTATYAPTAAAATTATATTTATGTVRGEEERREG